MKQLSRSERVTLAIVAIAVLAGGVAPSVAPDQVGTAMMYDAAVLAATTLGLAGALRLPPERRGDWWFVPVGCVMLFAGDVIWDIYEFALDEPSPLPSIADFFYLGAYPLLLAGVIGLLRRRTDADLFNTALDVGTLGLAVGLLVWEPLLAGSGRGLAGSVIAGAYPLFDVLLIGLAAVLVGARRASQSSLLLLGGAGVLFIADLTYLVLQNAGRYSTGGWPDPLFVIGPFLLAASPWFDTATDPDDLSARRRLHPVATTGVVIAALVALPIDFAITEEVSSGPDETVVRLLLRVLLLVFVGARLLRQALRNESLVDELETSSTQLSTVIQNTTDAVVFTTPDAVILEWNAAAEKLFGFRRDEVLGRSVLEFLVRDEHVTQVHQVMRGLTRDGGMREFTLHLELNGAPTAVMLQAAAVFDAHQRPLGFVTVARDDTRSLLSRHALESFAHLDPPSALAKFAYELRAFVPFDSLTLAAVEDDRFRELARVTATGDHYSREMRVIDDKQLVSGFLADYDHANLGDEPYVLRASSIALPLRDALTGELRGVLALLYSGSEATVEHAEMLARLAPDVSQSVSNMILYARERQTAERLQELDDLREGFFAMVAHEVRSPLGAIGTAAAVLRDHGSSMDAESARELASGITTGARRLARLTGDLVDASRGGHGGFPCEMNSVADLGAIVETAAIAAAGSQRNRVRVDTEHGISLLADADRLAQVVTNLVTNALKFSDGPVEVRLRRDGDTAVLRVEDHGPGIPASEAHRLYQRFARLPLNNDGPRPSGTGLGLFITRQLVLAHGGTIEHVATPGGGATFEVRVPCCA